MHQQQHLVPTAPTPTDPPTDTPPSQSPTEAPIFDDLDETHAPSDSSKQYILSFNLYCFIFTIYLFINII